eukprot:1657300-Pyramimonas_sp.AAC.1
MLGPPVASPLPEAPPVWRHSQLQVGDGRKWARLRRHCRASCPRKRARRLSRFQSSVPRWGPTQAAAKGHYAISLETHF